VSAIAHHRLPDQGIASTIGVPNGPLQVLLMMPFAALTRAPLAGTVFVALVNVAAVYFLFRFVDEWFGRRPALIAAALFAVNSWAVVYSRHLAVQGMLIPFQVLFFWRLARWLGRGRGVDLVLAFACLAAVSQVYIDGLLQAATLLLVLALGWRNIRLAPLLTGAALCGILLLPYMADAVMPNLARFRSISIAAPAIDAQSIGFALYQSSHEGFEVTARQIEAWPFVTAGVQAWLTVLEELLFAAGALYTLGQLVALGRRGEAPRARVYALLWLWLLVPIAIYVRHSEVLSWRHLALVIPLPAIFSAQLLDRFWPALGAPALVVVGGNSVALAGIYLAAAPTCVSNNVYGLPYQSTMDIAGSIERLAAGSGAKHIYVDGYPSLPPILTSILARDGFDAVWSDPEHGPELGSLPGSPSVYVTLSDQTDTARLLRSGFASQQAFSRDLPCTGMTLRTYAIAPAQMAAVVASQPSSSLDLSAANGLRLPSALLDRRLTPGQPVRVGVSWVWPGGSRPTSDYWLFAHLVDASGRVVGQRDVPLRPSAGWIEGESILSWLDVPVPPDAAPDRYSLEIGLYDNHGARVELAGSSGSPVGSSVVIQPLVVPPPASPNVQLTPAGARFGDQIELTGFSAMPAGGITLRWQALRQPDRDYSVFVHAFDPSGKLIAQADAEPDAGRFPTSLWLPGETVLDEHKLALPPGQYRVEVGLYYLPTLERLPGQPFAFRLTTG
jgi:hypothetical protein